MAREHEGKKEICFKLLGAFSYAWQKQVNGGTDADRSEREKYTAVSGKVGKKTLSFLQYLIINHSRNITAEELIEVFWEENNSSNPANALRNMLFKIRSLLREMFPGQDDLLQTHQGCYAWNSAVEIVLDAEQFERICLEARRNPGEEGIGMLRRAAAIYQGDFLPGNDSEWAKTQRQYYRTLFLDACKVLLPVLEEKEEWLEIVGICSQAYQINFGMEEFTAYQMRAFIAMGQSEQAIEKYEIFSRQMMKEFGMPPTERIEQIYTLALGLRKENRGDDGEIFKLVCDESDQECAFFCSFGIFRSIVALEKRHLVRSGRSSTLVIVSLGKETASVTDVRRLEHTLLESLRTGDPVARLEAGSYILMLTGADEENAQIVISRLDCAFHKTYRHSSAQLSFKISQLCPDNKNLK